MSRPLFENLRAEINRTTLIMSGLLQSIDYETHQANFNHYNVVTMQGLYVTLEHQMSALKEEINVAATRHPPFLPAHIDPVRELEAKKRDNTKPFFGYE